ncbi:unnamed protein product [Psylliodes chrysocephalus]|uniref:Uncharacterized protein n=1 Tax=Psylliodes chrysocephalus TaxID=3402493 RepID=A0A9P0CJS2_9CUCU|nr:unnamed protein product [Psylliodes chrysocephala]
MHCVGLLKVNVMNKLVAWCLCVSTTFLVVGAAKLDHSYRNQKEDGSLANQTQLVEECLKKEIKFEPCCGSEYFLNYGMENSKIIKDCFLHSTSIDKCQCNYRDFKRNKVLCIYQCIGQKLGYIDIKGRIIPDRYKTYMTEKLSLVGFSEDFQSKIIEGVLAFTAANSVSIGGCKSDGEFSQIGLNKRFIIHCPEDQMKDKQLCKIMQKRLEEAPYCLP